MPIEADDCRVELVDDMSLCYICMHINTCTQCLPLWNLRHPVPPFVRARGSYQDLVVTWHGGGALHVDGSCDGLHLGGCVGRSEEKMQPDLVLLEEGSGPVGITRPCTELSGCMSSAVPGLETMSDKCMGPNSWGDESWEEHPH